MFRSPLRTGAIVAIAATAGMSLVSVAGASTIINDQFTGVPGTSINGRTPDTADPQGSTWVEYASPANQNGSTASIPSPDIMLASSTGGSTADEAAFPLNALEPGTTTRFADFGGSINFTVDNSAAGAPITGSATLNPTDNGAEWLAVGLGPTSQYGPFAAGGGPWALLKANGTLQVFATGNTGTPVSADTTTLTSGAHNIELSFNPGTSTLTVLADGTPVGTPYVYAAGAAPTIGSLFVDDRYQYAYAPVNGADNYGTFTNVMVTGSAVPEPATLAVLGVGAAGLLARRRRRIA